MEQKKLKFEISYTLDLLCFLDKLADTSPYEEKTEIVTQFRDALTPESHKRLKRIKKCLPKKESIQSLIAPLIVADENFLDLKIVKTSEILGNSRYLINQFKKSPQFKKISPTYKKFLKKRAPEVISNLEDIVKDLEQTKFKSYWLSKKLVIIKRKITDYQLTITPLNLSSLISDWSGTKLDISEKNIYVLTFSNKEISSLLNGDYIVSSLKSTNQLIRALINEAFESESFKAELRPLIKKFKKNKRLMMAFKTVKKEYRTISDYIQSNLILAITTYLNEQTGAITHPHEYLKAHHFGTHKIAILFYEYINLFPKSAIQPLNEYILELLDCVDLQDFEQDIERLS